MNRANSADTVHVLDHCIRYIDIPIMDSGNLVVHAEPQTLASVISEVFKEATKDH